MALLGDVSTLIFISNHNARLLGWFSGSAAILRSFLFRLGRLAGWSWPPGIVGGRRPGCRCAVLVVEAELRVAFDVADVPDSNSGVGRSGVQLSVDHLHRTTFTA